MSFLLPLGTHTKIASSPSHLAQYSHSMIKLFDGLDESNVYHTCGPAEYQLPFRNYTDGDGDVLHPHDARYFPRFALRLTNTTS